MDRLLLLMPRFMDYEKSLKENLNRKYEVCWLDSDEFDRSEEHTSELQSR